MFLDGMGDQLSGLERDEAGGCDHAEGDPLDGIEEVAEWDGVGERLAEEGEEVLGYSGGDQGGGGGVSGLTVGGEVAEEAQGDEDRGDGGVEGYGLESQRGRRDGDSPAEIRREAGVAAFGEVSEREEGPDKGGAGGPSVEGAEGWEASEVEVEGGRDDGEEEACGGERRDHQEKNGVGEEIAQVGDDEQKAGEDEGGQDGEEAGVPDFFGVEADFSGCAEAQDKAGDEANGCQCAEGGQGEVAEVDEIGVHGWQGETAGSSTPPLLRRGFAQDDTSFTWRGESVERCRWNKKTDPRGRVRSAGEPVLRRRDPAVVL